MDDNKIKKSLKRGSIMSTNPRLIWALSILLRPSERFSLLIFNVSSNS